MTPTGTAGLAFLCLVVLSAGLAAYRRARTARADWRADDLAFPGSRWGAGLRVAAAAVAAVILTFIATADPYPLADRLFPNAGALGREEIVQSYRQLLAATTVGIVGVAALTDIVTTLVRPGALRHGLLFLFTVSLLGITVYAGLFVGALLIS